ncbi:MAG: GtrA family protein [Clostridia bacterium]|nr:GtrA family protein [Clostridia bacterium]
MKKRLLNIVHKLNEMIETIEKHEKWGWIVQFVKFSIVGVINTLIDLGVYYFCLYILHFHYQLATFFGFIVSVTNAYLLNGLFVFSDGQRKSALENLKTYGKTVAGYASTYLLSVFLMWLWVDVLHIPEGVAPLLRLIITVPLNYLINKFWTFKKSGNA